MKSKTLLCSFLTLLLSVGTTHAETEQSVVINGYAIDKFVNNLTFNGNNVTLHFEDNTSQTEDMALVNISFNYGSTTDISFENNHENTKLTKVYNLNGQYIGNSTNGLGKGIYIVNGKKTVIK